MRKIYKFAFALFAAMCLFSCAKEVLEPEQQLEGDFVKVGSSLVNEYVSFRGGKKTVYFSGNLRIFAEDALWRCKAADFKSAGPQKYCIVEGQMYVAGKQVGKVSVDGDDLTIGSEKYRALKGFKQVCYPKISPSGKDVALPYNAHSASIQVPLVNPIPEGTLTVLNSSVWLSNFNYYNGVLSFDVAETTTDRETVITLQYTEAEDCSLNLKQQPSTFIRLKASEGTYNYARQSVSIDVEIENPVGGSVLSASTAASWISNLKVSGKKLLFDLAENNGTQNRTARIILSYSGSADMTYTLTQTWASTSIELAPSTRTVGYNGGTFSVSCNVINPRSGATVTATTADNWITNVAVSGSTLSFKVAKLENAKGRDGTITVKYGTSGTTYATTPLSVTQTGAPVTALALNKSTLSLVAGDSETLIPTVTPRDAELTWSSDHPEIASVDDDGKVTAIGAGSATVSVISGGKIATCSVIVNRATPMFSISTTTMSLDAGETGEIQITSDSDCTFTASSSNTSVATVSVSGKSINVKGVADGTATITVNCPQTSKYSAASPLTCSCTVEDRVNLSANGTANCYIVPTAGKYKFKATVKGNSTTSVGTPASVEVLWESFGTRTAPNVGAIVKSVSLSDGYVYIETPSTLADGNAVIAVKDASGTILWSWHIWVCKDYDPLAKAQVYNNTAGTMMDRNLGATSATPGDARALGLFYQWGRKDPFLGSSSIRSTLTWPSAVSSNSSNGTINFAVQHPTTFIKYNSSNYDWYYTGSSSTDNTRWQTSDKTKGIYDPCPPG